MMMQSPITSRRPGRENRKFGILLGAAAISVLPLICPWVIPPACAKDTTSSADETIRLQIRSDMLDGADDYFGENSDLSYVDGVKPTPPPPPALVVIPTYSGPSRSDVQPTPTPTPSPDPTPNPTPNPDPGPDPEPTPDPDPF